MFHLTQHLETVTNNLMTCRSADACYEPNTTGIGLDASGIFEFKSTGMFKGHSETFHSIRKQLNLEFQAQFKRRFLNFPGEIGAIEFVCTVFPKL
ncbi:hypothetical protein EBR21_09515 [bacterium]|nr:hypothetical protein [bacterium]